jgi:hypothetical protein
MFDHTPSSSTSDIRLLLRAHAEARWLSHEVVPVLRQLEQPEDLPEEQLGAALAYLEVLWIEASQRAAETDAGSAELETWRTHAEPPLDQKAISYHRAVLNLREVIAERVARLVTVPEEICPPHTPAAGGSQAPGQADFPAADRVPSPPHAKPPFRSAVALHALRRRPAGG